MTPHLQEALCQLVTDGELRRRLRERGPAALAGWRLAGEECAALCAIPPEVLERYARSLLVKRAAELTRAIPLSVRVVPTLGERYARRLASSPACFEDSVLSPGLREALRLLAPLRAELDGDEGEAPWAGDLLALEVLRAASRADGEVRITRLSHELRPVVRDLERGLIPVEVARTPRLARCDREGVRWRPA